MARIMTPEEFQSAQQTLMSPEDFNKFQVAHPAPAAPAGSLAATMNEAAKHGYPSGKEIVNSALGSGVGMLPSGILGEILNRATGPVARTAANIAKRYIGHKLDTKPDELGQILESIKKPPTPGNPYAQKPNINPQAQSEVEAALKRGPATPQEPIPAPLKTSGPMTSPGPVAPKIAPAPRTTADIAEPTPTMLPPGGMERRLMARNAQDESLNNWYQSQRALPPAPSGIETSPPTQPGELEQIMQKWHEARAGSPATPPATATPVTPTAAPQETFGTPSIPQGEIEKIIAGSKDTTGAASKFGVTPESQALDIQDMLHKPAVPLSMKDILAIRKNLYTKPEPMTYYKSGAK